MTGMESAIQFHGEKIFLLGVILLGVIFICLSGQFKNTMEQELELVERPKNQKDIAFSTIPPSVSLDEAAEALYMKKNQVHALINNEKLNFGICDGLSGKRIIEDSKYVNLKRERKELHFAKTLNKKGQSK